MTSSAVNKEVGEGGEKAVAEIVNSKPTSAPATSELIGQLKWYYARVFPIKPFVRWLRYGRDETLSKREISFMLPGDIYVRWRSFASGELLHEALKQSAPVKMDIGAMYNFSPADKNTISGTLTPMSKELVFDIDMTDYGDVLGEMGGGNAVDECDRCWAVMATAVEVLETALRDDFGFKHIMWVYSGRRGVHCWVGDLRARQLTNEQRSAVADFLHVRFEGREQAGRRQNEVTVPMHPSLARARRMCDATFRDFSLTDARVLDTEHAAKGTVSTIPRRETQDGALDRVQRMAGGATGVDKWDAIEKVVRQAGRNEWSVRGSCDYIVLRHVYPRLDVNVSKELNHLLKAPFCVHPSTGRVCVPFRAARVRQFGPKADAPDIASLLRELEKGDGQATKCLRAGVAVFEEWVDAVEREAMADIKVERLEQVDRNAVRELLAH